MQVIGWIILGILTILLCYCAGYVLDDRTLKKYMLIIGKKVHYFGYYKEVVSYIKLCQTEDEVCDFELYVRDKDKYIFVTNMLID